MNEIIAKELLDKIVGQIFGYQNPLTLDQAMTKFAFDVRLPQEVFDASTGQPTWVASMNQSRFVSSEAVKKRLADGGDLQQHREMTSIDDVLTAWKDINYATSDRQIDSSDVAQSDGVYHSQYVYRSIDIRKSKNILFCDGVDSCDHVVAGQTSKTCQYTIRVEDSKNISSSFNVVWSNKITNSLFIQDCFDLDECMFCTHLAGKKFCIANIQYTEEEYRRIKKMIILWIFQS